MNLDSLFCRFLAVSLAVHLLAFLYWARLPVPPPTAPPIPVALLPIPEPAPQKQETARPSPPPKPLKEMRMPREAATRLSRAPALLAKKDSPLLDEPAAARRERAATERPPQESPQAFEFQDDSSVVQRPLPGIKELLPAFAKRGEGIDRPISLNSNDPKYKTYLTDVKQIIDANWSYPSLALQYGLQGTAVIEFVILDNGSVEGLRLVRSSGSRLLDQEVLRAILAAAPFRRFPPWMETNRLWVSATMEYHDGRFKAWLGR